jgi:hypothetical protein
MSYLFIKICFKEKSLYHFHKKLKILKNPKKPQKTFLVGSFGWVFYCQPCLVIAAQLLLLQL